MIKLRALNRELSSDDDAPTIRKEAQEEITLDLYNKALRLQCENEYEESIQILKQLLEENIPQLQSQGGLPKTMSTIKYSCYINIGAAFIKLKNGEEAIKFYLQGSELDGTDVTLWYKIGILALQLDRFNQAAVAFMNGLKCNDEHWPCLDNLISVLYVVDNYLGCLEYIQKALQLEGRYMKGLVLRKYIYTNTPAISIYFPAFKPNDQDLNQFINTEQEVQIMKNIDNLSERLATVQKNLMPNKIVEVPLPSPLVNYTWIDLGKTITSFRQYITDQRLSHFSTIQVLNDQPITSANVESTASPVVEEVIEIIDLNPDSTLNNGELSDENITRRMSINSETDRDKDTTPNQTDNDEMEQDTEDQDDPNDLKKDEKTKMQVRSTKRKRDLLSDLQIWGWHSKRKQTKKGKYERELSVEAALTRIIPASLLPHGLNGYNQNDDSTATTEMYNLHVESIQPTMKLISPISSPASLESGIYFDSDLEKTDVMNFWTEQSQNDCVNQTIAFVQHLATKWDKTWPSALIPLYIDAYNMYREHYSISPTSTTLKFETIYNDAMSTLLYGEFILFYSKRGKIHFGDNLRKVDTSTILFLETCAVEKLSWAEKYTNYVVRVLWLKAHVLQNCASNKLAIHSLKLLSDVMHLEEETTNQSYSLKLPNCEKSNIITMEIITQLVKKIGMIDSVNRLETLFTAEQYDDVIAIIKMTFSYTHPVEHGRVDRPAQLGMLLHALKCTDRAECFIWAEICLHEALGQHMKRARDDKRWEMIVLECLEIMLETVRSETVSAIDILPEPSRCRFVKSLFGLCSRQVNRDGMGKLLLDSVIPWILLHYVILREEHRLQAKKVVRHIITDEEKSKTEENSDDDDFIEMPASIAILFSAHEFLGPKACCVVKQGELLHFILDTIVDRLDTPIFESLRERIDIHLEQAFFCLYQHPSKKNKISRHLADHNVDPLPLTWARAQQLYSFFCPTSLPEFDSYKSISISAELEQLLQRICSLVPSECDPNPTVGKVSEFVRGISDTLPEPIEFPTKVRSMYYLLGDFFFKQSEVKRSYRYFLLDLCINPDRVDTWACIALGNASQLEAKLNHCERFKSEQEFLDKARSTRVCFQKALELTADHATLWIEFGSFEYMAHSFCSRLLKCESETLSMERFETLENQKEDYLKKSLFNFTKALELYQPDQNEADERWLYYYTLGKIAEKQHKEPNEYLQHYLTAQTLLHENKATYPEKINYNNPQHLSLEALEVHYRINSSILKYLELHEGKAIPTNIGKVFRKCLEESLFAPDKIEPLISVKPIETLTKPSNEPENETEIIILGLRDKPPELITVETPDVNVEIVLKSEQTSSVGQEVKMEDVKEVDLVQKAVSDTIVIEVADEISSPEVSTEVVKVIEEIPVETPMEVVENDNKDPDKITENAEIIELSDAKPQENAADVTLSPNISTLTPTPAVDNPPKCDDAPLTTSNFVDNLPPPSADLTEQIEPITESLDVPKEPATHSTIAAAPAATVEESSSSSSSSSSSDSDSDDSSSSSSSSSTSTVTSEAGGSVKNAGNMSEHEIGNLIDRCLLGLEQCIKRLPQNYKALYRIAHLHFAYKKKRDLNKCRQLFLTEYKCKSGSMVSGLFADRKPSNFFNGIWRIPSSEIDRPGSLAAHMARCVTLLLQALRDTHDQRTLLDLCIMLRRVPDPDKVYLRHTEREQLAEQAFAMYTQALRGLVQDLDRQELQGLLAKGKMYGARERLLGDVYRGYQRVQKMVGTGAEDAKAKVVGGILTDVYKKLMVDIKLPDNINILDLALKYCLQSRAADKLKKQQTAKSSIPNISNLTTSSSIPLAATTPYLPTSTALPTSTLQSSTFAYLAGLPSSLTSAYPRRPSLGRPRGRPPGPKLPTMPKGPRGRPPLNTQAQQAQSAYSFPYYPSSRYDYAKKYEQELLRQYSQMTQNPYMTTTASSLLNANLMQQLSTMATMTTASNSFSTASLAAGLNSLGTNPMTTLAGSVASHQQIMQYLTAAMRLPNATPTTSSSVTDGSNAALINMAAAALLQQQSSQGMKSSMSGLGSIPSTSSSLTHGIPVTSSYGGIGSSSMSNMMRGVGAAGGFKMPSSDGASKAKAKESIGKAGLSAGMEGIAGNIPVKELLKQAGKSSGISTSPSYRKPYISPPDHPKPKPAPKPTSSTSSILKDRPSISITPVNTVPQSHNQQPQAPHRPICSTSPATLTPVAQHTPSPPLCSSPSSTTSSPGKTLQEKLAEKQKQQQQMMNAQNAVSSRKLDFGAAATVKQQASALGALTVTTTAGSSKGMKIPKGLDVLPAFSRDAAVTISTVPPNIPVTTYSPKHSLQSHPKPNVDRPALLSVIKKPEEQQEKKPVRKESSDDDVILID